MNRPIDADALKNMKFSHGLHDNGIVYVPMGEVMKNIDKAPTIGGWISVKDRTPENIKPVLVWESQGFAYVDNYIDGDWSIGSANGAIITHWMPLPEAPKEKT